MEHYIPRPVLAHIEGSQDAYAKKLIDFLKIPSISTLPAYSGDVRRAAEWLLNEAKRLGFKGALYETPGHPVMYAGLCPYKDAPTLLVYGHYDVQPPDPVDQWCTPPFTPVIRDGNIFARGATDDKGQLLTFFNAIESILAMEGKPPLNIKIVMEGEEEIGSPNFMSFVSGHRELLNADVAALSDGSKYRDDMPMICYGLRGLLYMQIDVYGPSHDVHSGLYGGAVANPAMALSWILGGLKDARGKVLIPGFYDSVHDIEPWEREEMAGLPFDEEAEKARLGVDALVPEEGYTVLESTRARPTLDINGIWGGFQGEGSKTIIPAQAGAKVSMRLVPDQDPGEIARLFERYVMSLAPCGVKVKVSTISSTGALIVPRDSVAIKAAERAIEEGFGRRPVFMRDGGSIGAVIALKAVGIDDILMLGWGDPGDQLHSPNEHFSLENFRRGTIAAASLIYGLAGIK
ncbi:dipeptidase [Methanocella conradii]|uniref:dipeptidase n=1 Tax=Methanocella conradii TaxID=1175444 RepID=UPI0024B3A0BA|nr:dipeptidase [Methanocella conradii]MDI6896170.1 dipeptidase [Methanocella conradii]